jgi:UDP-4-amino-4,6-dideoxy-N-acetyl-beta-L-altrosamine transaminase
MILIKKPEYGKRVNLLIIGAGVAGELIGKHILNNPKLNYHLVCFVDDDLNKIGSSLYEVPIFGPISKIKEIILNNQIDEILIAAPSVSGDIIKKLVNSIKGLNVQIKILPVSFETQTYLEQGKADFEAVRELKIEDFFRRKPVISDFKKIKDYFSGKTVLVTGAAGSIGSELCRQLLYFNISKLIALDNRETALHDLTLELGEKFPEKFFPVMADLRDKTKIKKIFEKFRPSIAFHAAAYKHVPMMEFSSDEAIKTNVFGTKNVIDISDETGVKDFILISTDKAVNPKSVMGATKRVAEMIMQAKSKNSKTNFIAVRFGNVLNSDGSVVPLFNKQIEKGGPITITHPDMKRFFMAIPEAAQLVIQGILLGKSGDLFILDMGEQYKVLELAEEMVRLKGLEPYIEIPIKIVGLRDGEKIYEELLNNNEIKNLTENERIFLIKCPSGFSESQLEKNLEELKVPVEEIDEQSIIIKLKEMVPDFEVDKKRFQEKYIPYNRPSIRKEEIEEVVNVLKSGWLTQGPKTFEFEKQLADYLGVKHAIAVNSCTAALHLSLIVSGIGQGDEVIVPSYTFASTANVVCAVGAKPIFADVQEDTFNIDPIKIEQAVTEKTKAIIVVHYGGQAADMDEIQKIADKYNLKIIEDAAHAIGSEYKGKKIGSLGNLTCFSFYATKNLTMGEGGAITTNDDNFASKLKILRLHGISKDAWNRYSKEGSWYYEIEECGWKYNLGDIQAALGLAQLKKLDDFTKKRQEIAEIYDRKLGNNSEIVIPIKKQDRNNVYHVYPILLKNYDRKRFIEEMQKRNIGTSVHFIPLHLHPFYQREFRYRKGDFPISEKLYDKEVSLPLYPDMTEQEINRVILAVEEILSSKSSLTL